MHANCEFLVNQGNVKKQREQYVNILEKNKSKEIFYEGKSPKGSRTHWVLHEYRLVSVETGAANSSHVSLISSSILWKVKIMPKTDRNIKV